MVNDPKHIFAIWAAVLGVDLRDGKLRFFLSILVAWDGFDGDVEPSNAVPGKYDIFLTGFGNGVGCWNVLRQLWVNALCSQNGIDELLLSLGADNEDFTNFVPSYVVHFEFDGV